MGRGSSRSMHSVRGGSVRLGSVILPQDQVKRVCCLRGGFPPVPDGMIVSGVDGGAFNFLLDGGRAINGSCNNGVRVPLLSSDRGS